MNLLVFTVFIVGALTAVGVSPAELDARLGAGKKLTIVDVRSPAAYEKDHIANAINIPAVLCPGKKLPSIGSVVVYDDGLGNDQARGAAVALNAKPGIQAEVLEGGFAAWTESRGQSTQKPGMKPEEVPMISYAQLTSAQSNGVVLVDLRTPPAESRQGTGGTSSAGPAEPLTNLRSEFPGAAVASSPFQLPQTRQAAGGAAPLMVLIDNGDGKAQAMARTLKANGVHRFVILAGGESILARHGRAGLQRTGGGTATLPPGLNPVPANK